MQKRSLREPGSWRVDNAGGASFDNARRSTYELTTAMLIVGGFRRILHLFAHRNRLILGALIKERDEPRHTGVTFASAIPRPEVQPAFQIAGFGEEDS